MRKSRVLRIVKYMLIRKIVRKLKPNYPIKKIKGSEKWRKKPILNREKLHVP